MVWKLWPVLSLSLPALFLAGCNFGPSYPRFDEAGVVSINPLHTEKSKESERLVLAGILTNLNGSWVATNKYPRPQPPVLSSEQRTNQISKSSNSVPSLNFIDPGISSSRTNLISQSGTGVPRPVVRDQKPEEIEVVTIMIFDGKSFDGDAALDFPTVTIESYTGGELSGRSTYAPRPVKLKGDMFLDLMPDLFTELSLEESGFDRSHHIPTYWFLKVQPQGRTLEVARLDKAWLRKLLEKKPKSIRHASAGLTKEIIVLTDTPQALQRFLRRHAGNPEAFNVTKFYRSGGAEWSAESLRSAVRAAVDELDHSQTAVKLGIHEAIVQVREVVNRTNQPIDTAFIRSVLSRRLHQESSFVSELNTFFYLNPILAEKVVSQMSTVLDLSGEVVMSKDTGSSQQPAGGVLRLLLKNKKGELLWTGEQPLR